MAQYMGIAFPFQEGDTSVPATVTDEDLVRQSLFQIILTQRFERVMRPEFGLGAFDFIFENNDDILAARVQRDVKSAIARFEPRALVTGVGVEKDEEGTSAIITVDYVLVSTGTTQQASVKVPA